MNIHGGDSFTNRWFYWLTFKTILLLAHLVQDIAETLLGIGTSALLLGRGKPTPACTIGVARH